ncbi:archaetidylserine decarboxylase [Colwellia echini]|uniref:phosphatidylserine decarboxylase n=1 Tax=Colwellia echini TaxID=1982103 RepID=A0ABY3MX50_9GAMM|nr:archaetidylserine decarboxylase [Colwellia echini]TYK65741.1 phosphatidylserine decarboxylase [Colwellia echini]
MDIANNDKSSTATSPENSSINSNISSEISSSINSYEIKNQQQETSKLTKSEQLNFLLTNRIPRRYLTLFMGWFSKIEQPLVTKLSIMLWKVFAEDLKLEDAKKSSFSSLNDCFTRELKPGLRPVDNDIDIVTSPCDAIVGECGEIDGKTVFQAKGFPYEISELIPDFHLNNKYKNGKFITLRLKSSMYHRFHAPIECEVKSVTYISGDTWNVNPITLKRIERLFCRNERAVIELKTPHKSHSITLVPVAAVLVACMKFNFLKDALNLKYKGPNKLECNASFNKGDEMGYFEHGSTIILFATANYELCEGITSGTRVNMGQALLMGHDEKMTEVN